jgi:Xaa-Pro aminopeptidase
MHDERSTKQKRVAAYLDGHGLDAVLLARRCNFSWYTCGAHNHVSEAADVGASWLLVDRDGARVLANNIEAARLAGEELVGTGIDVAEFPWFDPAEQRKALARLIGRARLGVDAKLPWPEAEMLGGDFDRLRWVLTAWEIERYRALCDDTVAAVESVACGARSGCSELDLAAELSAALRRRGCLPWVLLAGGDQRLERFRHPLPTDNRIQRQFMLVACAERCGLICACSRLGSFGKIPAEMARKHQAVTDVDTALVTSTRPGVTLGRLFAVAQEAYAACGFPDQWRMHHQGGSCGYLPREVKAAPGDATVALENQAFAWNPSISGTKSEDTILCRADGGELLAKPTDWPTITGQWQGRSLPRADILAL